ncbi:MAG TPA: hypothetical protein VL221_11065 [Bacteroidota bacterium]|nr:hypothetical protein [Bacteroidota bacterium]
MLPEIWEPGLTVVFAAAAIDEVSATLGFRHMHPRSRFWDLLATGGLTEAPVMTKQERKALEKGHREGSLSDPVRSMFFMKKTSLLLRRGIGLTELNRRVAAAGEKDRAAAPTGDDVRRFLGDVERMRPAIVALIAPPETVLACFPEQRPDAAAMPGPQRWKIGDAEVWALGSTTGIARGEAATRQEDAFFALGERVTALRGQAAGS